MEAAKFTLEQMKLKIDTNLLDLSLLAQMPCLANTKE